MPPKTNKADILNMSNVSESDIKETKPKRSTKKKDEILEPIKVDEKVNEKVNEEVHGVKEEVEKVKKTTKKALKSTKVEVVQELNEVKEDNNLIDQINLDIKFDDDIKVEKSALDLDWEHDSNYNLNLQNYK